MNNNKRLFNIYNEHVNIKQLLLGLTIQLTLLIPIVFINEKTKLMYGITVLVLCLVLNNIIIKPKRNIKTYEVNKDDN